MPVRNFQKCLEGEGKLISEIACQNQEFLINSELVWLMKPKKDPTVQIYVGSIVVCGDSLLLYFLS